MTDLLSEFAAETATAEHQKPTYSPTHAAVALSDRVTAQGVKRDTDSVPFVAITRSRADGQTRTTYDRADRVAQYLAALARANEESAAQDGKQEKSEKGA